METLRAGNFAEFVFVKLPSINSNIVEFMKIYLSSSKSCDLNFPAHVKCFSLGWFIK